ncbi:MAG TPA: helix-turn-helix domain-containing protein [Streptosporangiaceae bacterium]|nr:helix-turn-helix domain-containing protein [Streptosporangiaceae bacterium]
MDRSFRDELTLSGADTEVYEAIATLEFEGHDVAATEIAESTGLDERTVQETLSTLTQRGMLHRTEGEAEPTYEPADRGWSAAPEQGENPAR